MTQPKQNTSRAIDVDDFHNEIYTSIKNVLDITSRIDERLKILYEKDEEYKNNFQQLFQDISEILQRLASNDAVIPIVVDDFEHLKNKVHELEIKTSNIHLTIKNHDDKWSKFIDWTFKIIVTGISIYAAYMIQQR